MNFKYSAPILLSGFLFLLISCGGKKTPIPGPDVNLPSVGRISGTVKAGLQPISEVLVTDGYSFAKTDGNGTFHLDVDGKAKHIYITSPSGYTVPVVQSVPQFYKEITAIIKNNGANFEIVKLDKSDDQHHFIAVGDPQVRNGTELDKLSPILSYMKQDIASRINTPLHILVTGDIVFDVSNMHHPSKDLFAQLGQPVYYAIGNHDHVPNKTSPASVAYDKESEKEYLKHYGPKYYSFNRGQVHYIVFDNIVFSGGPDTAYDVNITDEQLDWIKRDLSYVSKDKVVVLMTHSPTKSRVKAYYGNSPQLFAMLTGYKDVHIITGHTHYNSVLADNTNVTDHIIGAICGGWWEGPVCPDGTPIGYKVFEVNGTTVKWRYHAYQDASSQFSVFAPNTWTGTNAVWSELLVNVWDWDVNWDVFWAQDNGPYIAMPRLADRSYDPLAFSLYGGESDTTIPASRGWINSSRTDHLFSAKPNSSASVIRIKVVNPFGEEFIKTINKK